MCATLVQWLALSLFSSIPRTFSVVCMFFQCLHGFSPGTMVLQSNQHDPEYRGSGEWKSKASEEECAQPNMDNAERQGQMSSGFTFCEFLFHHHDILSVYHRIAWFGLKDKYLRAGAMTITQTKLKYKIPKKKPKLDAFSDTDVYFAFIN